MDEGAIGRQLGAYLNVSAPLDIPGLGPFQHGIKNCTWVPDQDDHLVSVKIVLVVQKLCCIEPDGFEYPEKRIAGWVMP